MNFTHAVISKPSRLAYLAGVVSLFFTKGMILFRKFVARSASVCESVCELAVAAAVPRFVSELLAAVFPNNLKAASLSLKSLPPGVLNGMQVMVHVFA